MQDINPPRSWQDQDMMAYLGREAPRYTSYPSAHHFTSLAPETYAGWLRTLPRDESIGLYVHIPFCEQMCWFCGCNTQITHRAEPVEAYVACLIEEIALVGRELAFRPSVHALHFGGGSPGILSPAAMTRVFEALTRSFDLKADAEISIELDPRQITNEKLKTYTTLGFNRVSLGVQDTQPQVQAAINRHQPFAVIAQSVAALRDHGLTSIGIDLLYGLPHQTADSLAATLNDIARLDPDRISAFSYAHVPWMKKHQQLIDTAALPDIHEKVLQYVQIDTQLRATGYAAVGIDHFAKASDGLAIAARDGTLRRNFMGYTDLPNDRQIAFGASSISQLDDGIAQNIPQSTSYQRLIKEGRLPTVRGWAYQSDDKVRGAVISDLMCRFECNVAEVLQRHGYTVDYLDQDIQRLADFVAAGIVTIDDRIVRFESPMKMLVRSVACVFDTYAAGEGGNRYSKVA
ncbi:oxygen-independent coproporphyrinogen III oxidase [Asticcacaulis sp. 201]|uniref:oxygen-independent coproporphyrinogen III oxidase n=1 Tax=Asticcacaulis sp. 201 TaxID=3028787 RepID=UPI002916E761|nr:oxygen-independent coproporphyrinogen III oxidase [Asticcacaulis sp. 201]MDV6331126.1 oxygen-independent coproporphyrinogen III oxidase [Asticcacaulis sp. 201]